MRIKLIVAVSNISDLKETISKIKESDITQSHPNVEIVIEVGKDHAIANQPILST